MSNTKDPCQCAFEAECRLRAEKAALTCCPERFPEKLYYQYHPPHHYVRGYELLPLYHKKWREEQEINRLSFLQNPQLKEKWEEFKNGLPFAEKRIINIPHPRNYQFHNYYCRYMTPEVTASYRMKLKPGPLLVGDQQNPIPADKLQQYRECY